MYIENLQMQIDKYHISLNNNYISICIDGQNIIHERLTYHFGKRSSVAQVAIELIEDYNFNHGFMWGEIK